MAWANDVYKLPHCTFQIDWVRALQSWEFCKCQYVIFDYFISILILFSKTIE